MYVSNNYVKIVEIVEMIITIVLKIYETCLIFNFFKI